MLVECKHCHETVEIAQAAGQWVDCPKCQVAFMVPPAAPAERDPLDRLPIAAAAAQAVRPPVLASPFISPGPRARAAQLALAAKVVVACLCVWSSWLRLDFLHEVQQAQATGPMKDQKVAAESIQRGQDNDRREETVGMVHLATIVASLILFLMWKYRAYKNLDSLNYYGARFSLGGAIGWYFCPVVNLWKPFQAMQDLWDGSAPPRSVGPAGGVLVALWWVSWVLDGIISNSAAGLTDRSTDTDDLIRTTKSEMAGLAVGIVSTALTIAVVASVTRRQQQRRQALQSQTC